MGVACLKFQGENFKFAGGSQAKKFMKVFSLKSFPLLIQYTICVLVHGVTIRKHSTTNKSYMYSVAIGTWAVTSYVRSYDSNKQLPFTTNKLRKLPSVVYTYETLHQCICKFSRFIYYGMLKRDKQSLYFVHHLFLGKHQSIIESVDSISRDGPDTPHIII